MTHSTLVENSFISQTTKLDPPLAHATLPRCPPGPLDLPGSNPCPYVSSSSSSILNSFLTNSLGPADDCISPAGFAAVTAVWGTAGKGVVVNPPGPCPLPPLPPTLGSCDTRSSSLTDREALKPPPPPSSDRPVVAIEFADHGPGVGGDCPDAMDRAPYCVGG